MRWPTCQLEWIFRRCWQAGLLRFVIQFHRSQVFTQEQGFPFLRGRERRTQDLVSPEKRPARRRGDQLINDMLSIFAFQLITRRTQFINNGSVFVGDIKRLRGVIGIEQFTQFRNVLQNQIQIGLNCVESPLLAEPKGNMWQPGPDPIPELISGSHFLQPMIGFDSFLLLALHKLPACVHQRSVIPNEDPIERCSSSLIRRV